MREIILASQSPQRKIIFQTLNLPFEVIPSDIDEKVFKAETHKLRAQHIAWAKAEKISQLHPEAIVIAADTFTELNGKAFEKPENLQEAETMLLEQSGQKGVCYTGFAYIDQKNAITYSDTTVTEFMFRHLSDEQIAKYTSSNPVLTWSAAFCPAYPEGIALIAHVSGSLSSFTHGLPIEVLTQQLEKSGVF